MESAREDGGYKLFAYLYQKRRVKDRRRELSTKQLEARTNVHWKALSSENRKKYNLEALKRMRRGNKKSVHMSSEHMSRHEEHAGSSGRGKGIGRARSVSPQMSRSKRTSSHRSRSPLTSRCRDKRRSRTRSLSMSTVRTEYLGGQDSEYSDYSSYTDTASTYYDDDDCDRSDATSCSSIALSLDDDMTEATQIEDLILPSTSKKSRKAVKPVKKQMRRQPAQKKKPVTKSVTKRAGKKSLAAETATKTTNTTPMPTRHAVGEPEKSAVSKRRNRATRRATKPTSRVTKPASRITKPKRVRVPRAVKSRKTIPLKKTPASMSVNVKGSDLKSVEAGLRKQTPPRRSMSDGKLKTDGQTTLATNQQVDEIVEPTQ